jgi:hypothetical protein
MIGSKKGKLKNDQQGEETRFIKNGLAKKDCF